MRTLFAALALAASGCLGAAPTFLEDAGLEGIEPSESRVDLEVAAPGVWVHTTYRDVQGFGRVLSNGIVVTSDGQALIVDAPWGDDPEKTTATLLTRLRADGLEVERAVFSHHHDDSVGGAPVFRRASVPMLATSRTADLMATAGLDRPDSVLEGGEAWTLSVGERTVEVFDAGPGHTLDNVVVYVPHARTLYGGCLIRPGGTTSLGNTADADIERWAESVARVRDRYPDLEVVVPSHGPPGGPELLDQTIALVENYRGRPVGG